MVKLTLIGRLRDGLPLAQTPIYLTEENEVSSFYREKGELVLKQISRGALSNPKMSILIDHHCFHYMIGNKVCYITLCESWYPRKLAFHYLQDLQKEFEKVDVGLVESFSNPYEFKRFDYVIGSIRKQYLDTRTQANLSKLKSDRRNDINIAMGEFSKVVNQARRAGTEASSSHAALQTESAFWSSELLEVIALKWIPIVIFVIVASLVLWMNIVLTEFQYS